MEYFEVITNAQTGQQTIRPYTAQEIAACEARAAEIQKENRIAELKAFLRDTDYVVLPDYDKDKPDIIMQRQAAREELRGLGA